jgi:hypothetical protein
MLSFSKKLKPPYDLYYSQIGAIEHPTKHSKIKLPLESRAPFAWTPCSSMAKAQWIANVDPAIAPTLDQNGLKLTDKGYVANMTRETFL